MRLLHTTRAKFFTISSLLLTLLLVGSLLMFRPAYADTPTFVQAGSNEINSGTKNNLAFANANGVGNLIVVYVIWSNTGTAAVTDSKGNSYASVAAATKWSGNAWSSQVFYAKNVAGGVNTVTTTFGTSIMNFGTMYIHEYSGIDKVNPLDVSKAASGTASAMNTGAVTTTNASDLLFSAGVSKGSVTATGAGYASRLSTFGNKTMDKNVVAIGSNTATMTQNSNAWAIHLIAFKANITVADTTAPSIPTGLVASAQSPTQINLSWTAASDNIAVTGYKIYRNGILAGSTASTNYQDTGLVQGTSYSYTVAAYDAANNVSAQSSPVAATTLVPPPDTVAPTVPSSLAAIPASTAQINLSWAISTDNVAVTGYHVFRDGTQIATTATNSYQDSGLATGVTYSYTVSAFDAALNESAPSSAVSATTQLPDTTAPTVPSGVTATPASSTQISVVWSPSSDNVGVAGYRVYRDGVQVASNVTTTSFQDTGLSPATSYAYTVSAFDAAANLSAPSAATSATTPAVSTSALWPRGYSANRRYLVDQNNNPLLIVGDTEHSIFQYRTTTEADAYFANRQSHGVNAIWVEILCNTYIGSCPADGHMYDGNLPFTTAAQNFDTPNPAYFAHVDEIVQKAADHGITLFLDPIDLAGWINVLKANGATKAYNYGVYLGNRYKNFPNIVWQHGNDYGGMNDAATDAAAIAVLNGIKSVDPNHLQTLENYPPVSTSYAAPQWIPSLQINEAYSYYSTYDVNYQAYNQTPTLPVLMVEGGYENESAGGRPGNNSLNTLRRQSYWSATTGTSGQFFGNALMYVPTDWATQQAALNSPGFEQFTYEADLIKSLSWWNLVPDQNHTFMTAGYGTYDPGVSTSEIVSSNYATASLASDGSVGLIYTPVAHSLTIDMSKLNGVITARWFDPNNNTYQTVSGSPFANTGLRVFTTPGNNSSGEGDWVLVLQANIIPDTTPPSTPSALTITATTGTQAMLSWTASTDNVGISGYKVFRNGVLVGTTTLTTFTDNGLSSSTTYGYSVTAFDAANNESSVSSVVQATTQPPDTSAPTMPTALHSTTVTNTQVTLAWTASTDNIAVSGYRVYRGGVLLGSVAAATYTDTGLSANTAYSYTVVAYDAAGNSSAETLPLSVTTTATPPANPVYVQVNFATPQTNQTTLGVKYVQAQAAGDINIVVIGWANLAATVTSVTDSAGNVYQVAAPLTHSNTMYQTIYYAKNIVASAANANIVTVNFSTAVQFVDLRVAEYSGIDQTNPINGTASGTGSAAVATSGSVTTTVPKVLLFGSGTTAGLFSAAGGGATQRVITSPDGDIVQDAIANTTGSYTASAVQSGAADYVMQVVALRVAGQ